MRNMLARQQGFQERNQLKQRGFHVEPHQMTLDLVSDHLSLRNRNTSLPTSLQRRFLHLQRNSGTDVPFGPQAVVTYLSLDYFAHHPIFPNTNRLRRY